MRWSVPTTPPQFKERPHGATARSAAGPAASPPRSNLHPPIAPHFLQPLSPSTTLLRVIRSGLAPSDRVVIDGVQRAKPGRKVKPTPGKIEDLAAQPPAKASPPLDIASPRSATSASAAR